MWASRNRQETHPMAMFDRMDLTSRLLTKLAKLQSYLARQAQAYSGN